MVIGYLHIITLHMLISSTSKDTYRDESLYIEKPDSEDTCAATRKNQQFIQFLQFLQCAVADPQIDS